MKTVWITGGSSGIGLSTAKKFFNKNWRVIISARDYSKLVLAKNEILKKTKNVIYLTAMK